MDLSLGFPEFSQELSVATKPSLEAVVARFRSSHQQPDSPVRAIHHQAATEGLFADMPASVDERLRAALEKRGITRLYVHQADAFERIAEGRNVTIVTPTASGKTLCYNLPVLNLLLNDAGARAMYLFPTKALAEDQLHEFNAAVEEMGSEIRAFTYDGDTPQDARKAIRQRANVVLTNPDMLHSGILPHHTRWARYFENLKYVVIDELHYYRGVYGSHLANLLRRLARICEFYGSKPQFVCCSATIANPRELSEALTGQSSELIERNGAPRGEKYFIFYNPPVVNRQLGIRRSYISETRRLALEFIERNLQTLVFANNRLATEILVTYLKDACDRKPIPSDTVRGYRGGYLPRERREIERHLRDGKIRAVVATNALELGIDIGSLDAVVMAGYPGTIASTWQRAGRAGRRKETSAAVLVASSAPLDQYVIEHPDYFFNRSPEHAYINPENLEILLAHLKCAAFELPIRDGEKFGKNEIGEICGFLEETGFLHKSAGAWHWTNDTYPADATSLRSVTSDNFVVIDITGEANVIADVSFPTALTTLHEKAIYLHEARQYHVERFDYDHRKAYVKRVDCDYYTDAIDYTQVMVLQEAEGEALAAARRAHGDVRVNRQIVGFKKIKFYTMENVGAGKLNMPGQEMHTTSFWLHFPAAFLEALGDYTPTERQSGISGLGNALRTVASLLLMCDPRDLGVALSEDVEGVQVFEPNLYLYDAYPGGVGLSAPLFRLTPRLLKHTAELLAACSCDAGCPSCVGPVGEVGERGKEVASAILRELAAGVSCP
ncbi:MAG TPA: DEAD/DEAH box helicase [Candidatus Sulfopaludibacter sp.]|jgi:DEAD/DEAH box helicase domain-containing protein|nr:DEAD/DEAH box helicase [Candidatus Sulfopaludibacter sp.]